MRISILNYVNCVLEYYGREHQMIKGAEECSELAQQFCKAAEGKVDRSALLEEIGDTLLMIEQAKRSYGISDLEIKEAVHSKMRRQLERIQREKDRLETPLGKIGDRRERA